MNPVDFRRKFPDLSLRHENQLRNLIHRFGKVKKNYVVKVRYMQTKMRYRRMKILLSILKQNTRVYWPAIFDFIKQNDYPSQSDSFEMDSAPIFLNKLLVVGCSDANIVEKILKLLGWFRVRQKSYLNIEEMNKAFLSTVCSMFHPTICDRACNEIATNYDVDLFEFALRANDLRFMTALVKYGYNVPLTCNGWFDTETQLFHFWIKWLRQVGVKLSDYKKLWKNKNVNAVSGNERGFRRFFLVIKILGILNVMWSYRERIERADLSIHPVYTYRKLLHDSMHCMKLYFRVTVEPLISKDDIVKFISSTPFWYGVPEDFLARVAQDYEDMFPEESNALYAPRSLKHLCRYSLRTSLTEKKVGVLPELVENLFLPKRLKSYLLCEY